MRELAMQAFCCRIVGFGGEFGGVEIPKGVRSTVDCYPCSPTACQLEKVNAFEATTVASA